MNHRYNRLRNAALHTCLVLSLVIFAPGASSSAIAPSTDNASTFCTNLQVTITKINDALSAKQAKLATAYGQRTQKLTDNRTKWDQAIAISRASWDQKRQASFAAMESKATTDTQKIAIVTYEHSINNAVSTRRSANDQARATYRDAVDDALDAQKATITTQAANYASTVQAAEDTATSSCANVPTRGVTIRSVLQASLKTARAAYTADRANDSKISTTIKQHTVTRDNTIKANDAAFTTATAAARQTLQATLHNSSL